MRAPSPRRRREGRRGLTLLEVTVALAIGVLVSAVATGIVGRTADVRDEIVRRTGAVAEARTALWVLRDELAGHRPGTLRVARPGGAGSPVVTFERDAPEPQRVTFRVERGRLIRVVRDRFRIAAPARRSILATGVRRLDLALLGHEGWRDAWSLTHPPRAMTLTLDAVGAPRLTVTLVPLVGGAA